MGLEHLVSDSRHSLDITQSKLAVLYAKRGRAQQFTTKAARDKYLSDEIKSLKVYENTQQKRVEDLTKDVDGAKEHLADILSKSADQTKQNEERREKLKSMGEEVTGLRSRVDGMQEQRK